MKELIEKRNDLITRAEDVLNGAKAETRELSEAENEELNNIRSEVEAIDKTIEQDEAFKAMEKREIKEDKGNGKERNQRGQYSKGGRNGKDTRRKSNGN